MTPQDTDNVRLVELDDALYREYRKHLVRDYAADKVRAGAWSKFEAESRAAKDIDGLLPEGPPPRATTSSIRSGKMPRAPRSGSYGSRSGTRASDGLSGSTTSSTRTSGAKAT